MQALHHCLSKSFQLQQTSLLVGTVPSSTRADWVSQESVEASASEMGHVTDVNGYSVGFGPSVNVAGLRAIAGACMETFLHFRSLS